MQFPSHIFLMVIDAQCRPVAVDLFPFVVVVVVLRANIGALVGAHGGRGRRKNGEWWRDEDGGGWKSEDGGWRKEIGACVGEWKMENRGRTMNDTVRRMADGG